MLRIEETQFNWFGNLPTADFTHNRELPLKSSILFQLDLHLIISVICLHSYHIKQLIFCPNLEKPNSLHVDWDGIELFANCRTGDCGMGQGTPNKPIFLVSFTL